MHLEPSAASCATTFTRIQFHCNEPHAHAGIPPPLSSETRRHTILPRLGKDIVLHGQTDGRRSRQNKRHPAWLCHAHAPSTSRGVSPEALQLPSGSSLGRSASAIAVQAASSMLEASPTVRGAAESMRECQRPGRGFRADEQSPFPGGRRGSKLQLHMALTSLCSEIGAALMCSHMSNARNLFNIGQLCQLFSYG